MSAIDESYPSSDGHLNESRNEREIEDVGEHLGHRDGGNLDSRDTHERKSELRSYLRHNIFEVTIIYTHVADVWRLRDELKT